MDKEAYTARITYANPAQLVVINFELILDFLDTGEIEKAREALDRLIRSLNFEISLAHDFYGVYKYVNELLIAAQFTPDADKKARLTAEGRELLDTLLTGWRDVEKQVETLPPVAGEVPKVYAGLTYDRDGMADEYIDDRDKKGYLA